jgi:hypothetical protein
MKTVFIGIVAAAAIAAITADAQESRSADDEASQPRISDIMAHQQERHIKLWFAGRGGNWALADYEVDALKDGFDDLSTALGGNTVQDAVGAPIVALEKAIDAKDRTAFTDAFDKLTAGCNSCHHTLDHVFIMIQRPSVLPYSDQSFAAPKK